MTNAYLQALKELYAAKGKEPDWRAEENVYADLVPKLIDNLKPFGFELVKPLNLCWFRSKVNTVSGHREHHLGAK